MSRCGRWIRMTALVVAVLGNAGTAGAGDLANAIRDLYGGDGIVLDKNRNEFHAPHFDEDSLQTLSALSSSIDSSVNQLSLSGTNASFTYDVSQAVFVQTDEGLGPLFAERAATVGAGRLDLAFAYSNQDFARFDGQQLSSYNLELPHEDPPSGFANNTVLLDMDIELEQDTYALFANYGLTEDWDLGVVFPLVHTRLNVTSKGSMGAGSDISTHQFCDVPPGTGCNTGLNPVETLDDGNILGPADPSKSSNNGSETGLGDVIIRSKFNFLEEGDRMPGMSVVGLVSLPTGDQDDLLGTGHTEFLGLLVASKRFGRFAPHLNVGYELSTGGHELNALRYIAGFEALVTERVDLSVDFLGRSALDSDVDIGDDLFDLGVGAKVAATDHITLLGGVLLPLNRNEGLRPNLGWTLGFEYAF